MSFARVFAELAQQAHALSVGKGWWEGDRNEAELIALMHAELSEALEGLRAGNPPSDHIPGFSSVEEEFADVILRIMDHAAARGCRVGEALEAKLAFNASRPRKHGGKAF